MGMAFALFLLVLLAPVLNLDGLVSFHHVCDLQLGVHLGEEEQKEKERGGGGHELYENVVTVNI